MAAARELCEPIIRRMNIEWPLDITALCRQVAAERGRPLHLLGLTGRGGAPTGLWVTTDTADYIFYNELASPLHRAHIVLHEIGHMVLAHAAGTTLSAATAQLLMPGLDQAAVRKSLSRSDYSATQEQEAEVFATLIMARAPSIHEVGDSTDLPADLADAMRRLGPMLGFEDDRRG